MQLPCSFHAASMQLPNIPKAHPLRSYRSGVNADARRCCCCTHPLPTFCPPSAHLLPVFCPPSAHLLPTLCAATAAASTLTRGSWRCCRSRRSATRSGCRRVFGYFRLLSASAVRGVHARVCVCVGLMVALLPQQEVSATRAGCRRVFGYGMVCDVLWYCLWCALMWPLVASDVL
jgi:hypothetical protein